jgi:hypothetical protein
MLHMRNLQNNFKTLLSHTHMNKFAVVKNDIETTCSYWGMLYTRTLQNNFKTLTATLQPRVLEHSY